MLLHCLAILPAVLFVHIVSFSSNATLCTAERSLHIGLHASWPSTSSIAEAVAWIAHTTSNEHVLPFLTSFKEKRGFTSENDNITDSVENQIILETVKEQYLGSLFSSTLNWVLHSRQFSPYVYLHYSIAKETLAAFPGVSYPPVFAVRANSARTTATLILTPDQLSECGSCRKVNSPTSDSHPFLHPLADEILLNPKCAVPVSTIVYADVLSSDFSSWLPRLVELADACEQPMAFRFWLPSNRTYSPSLQGFSVQATLKSTEYKVVDDRVFQTQLFADCGYGDMTCERKNTSQSDYLWPDALDKKSTFTGVQALQYVQAKAERDFEKALHHLRIFSEDGPSLTRSNEFIEAQYIDVDTERKLVRSVRNFRRAVGEQDLFFINDHAFDVYSLRQSTEKLMGCLSAAASATTQLKITARELGQDARIRIRVTNPSPKTKNILRVGLNFEELVPNSLIWFNDIFNDSRYKAWEGLALDNEDDLSSYIENVGKQSTRSTGDGMDHTRLVKVKSNHLSLLLVVDPGDEQHFGYLGIPESVIRADLPIHVGVIMVPNGQKSSMIIAAFHYFLRIKGRRTAIQFVSVIRQIMQYMGGGFQHVPITEDIIEMAFQQVAMQHTGEYHSASSVLQKDIEIGNKLEEAKQFASRLNLFKNGTLEEDEENSDDSRQLSLLCLLNGVVVKDVAADVIPLAVAEQQRIASLLKSEKLDDVKKSTSSFQKWVAADSNLIIINRFSQEMRTEERQSTYKEKGDGLSTIKASSVFALRNEIRKITYIGMKDDDAHNDEFLVTVWLAAKDHTSTSFLSSKSALIELAKSQFASRTKSRYAILPTDSPLNNALLDCHLATQCKTAVIVAINGRRVPSSTLPTIDDLVAEVAFAYESQTVPNEITGELRLLYQLHSLELESKCPQPNTARTGNDVVSFSTVADAVSKSNMTNSVYMSSSLSDTNEVEQPLSVAAVLDPVGRDAYVVVALLEALKRAYCDGDLHLQLILAPTTNSLRKHFDQPLTYQKFLFQPEPVFHEISRQRCAPRVIFHRLPQQNVLTVAVEPPRAWFVSSYATNYDMDNIVLGNMSVGSMELHAEYELKNLIVEGSCIDEAENPPQGLKLILENDSGIAVDTLVMANLGYFQLKVPTPGRWKVRLAPGPSNKIFSMKRMEMYKDGLRTIYDADSLGRVPIPVESFSGAGGILLRVERNPGMKGKSVLAVEKPVENDEMRKGLVGRVVHSALQKVFGWTKSSQHHVRDPHESARHRYETIHVFSVASGHLYERFLKIMISSVTKNASRPVKFWLLENYLSPSFKKVLPLFAKKHGAEIGMVTYRWPGWLRAQTEKQRIIWAYKILFLDVLFPLDVGRIIFVDSDQVIRGDLAELMDSDLKGAPYGYVPFCDSRKEVEGYRFWKKGFWKETLRGAKYRISALYVVDLNRFRETAAGDTLRYIYQTLSADPNSLSNLDQDLPNYASVASGGAEVVPIFDLPEEWLWCESWCDDESKKKAKAIDLCNNPMTKEPKLASAKRIISEWVDYDNAASKLTEELYQALLDKDESSVGDEVGSSAKRISTEAKDEL